MLNCGNFGDVFSEMRLFLVLFSTALCFLLLTMNEVESSFRKWTTKRPENDTLNPGFVAQVPCPDLTHKRDRNGNCYNPEDNVEWK